MTLSPSRDPNSSGLAAIVLAAGQSSRFGGDKRLALLNSKTSPHDTLLIRSVSNVLPFVDVVIVMLKQSDHGKEQALLGPLIENSKLQIHYSKQAVNGLSGSLKDGLEYLKAMEVGGLFVILADMPFVQPETFRAMIDSWQKSNGHDGKIIRPYFLAEASAEPRPGNPVLFAREWFEQLAQCEGDTGARHLLQANPEAVVPVLVSDPGVLKDIDAPEDLFKGSVV